MDSSIFEKVSTPTKKIPRRFIVVCFISVGFALYTGAGQGALAFTLENCMVAHEEQTSNATNNSGICMVDGSNQTTARKHTTGVLLPWTQAQSTTVMAAYGFGSIWLLFITGTVVDKWGIKAYIFGCCLVSALANLCMPILATRAGWVGAFVAYFLIGMTTSVNRTTIAVLCVSWAAKEENGTIMAILGNGLYIGLLLTMASGGVICTSIGWQYVFYLWGGLSLLWLVAFWIFFTSFPEDNPWLSKEEKDYIVSNRLMRARQTSKVPWRRMILSGPVLVVCLCFTAHRWLVNFIVLYGAQYMREAVGSNLVNAGFYSALPNLAQVFSRYCVGFLADAFKRYMSITTRTKLFNTAGLSFSFLFVILCTQLKCGDISLAVAYLTLQSVSSSLLSSGYFLAINNFAPSYSAYVTSMATIVGYLTSCIVLPYVVETMVPNHTPSEWASSFYTTAAICALGAVLFLLFGSADVQDWAKVPEDVKAQADLNEHGSLTGNNSPELSLRF